VTAPRHGYVTAIEAEPLGRAAMRLGAGRQRAEDPVDHGVGIRLAVRVGDQVQGGDLLAEIFARSPSEADQAAMVVQQVCHVGEAPTPHEPLVRDVID
jgi:thymidine phosphorylase